MTKRIKTRKQKFGVPRSLHTVYPNVQYVVDADESIDVSVCQADVEKASKKDPTACALAQAVQRELKADAAIIGISSSYVIRGAQAVRFATPESVRREIVSFDRHHDFQPGDYFLTPKSPTARLGATVGKPKKADLRSGSHSARRIHYTQKIRVLPKGAS